MRLWIIKHYHKFGDDAYPIFGELEPSESEMIAAVQKHGGDYDSQAEFYGEKEYLELAGPYEVPHE